MFSTSRHHSTDHRSRSHSHHDRPRAHHSKSSPTLSSGAWVRRSSTTNQRPKSPSLYTARSADSHGRSSYSYTRARPRSGFVSRLVHRIRRYLREYGYAVRELLPPPRLAAALIAPPAGRPSRSERDSCNYQPFQAPSASAAWGPEAAASQFGECCSAG